MGQYNQTGLFVGDGAFVRTFKHKEQYKYTNLKTSVRNKITMKEGKLIGKGFKGTRGKHGHPNFPRYRPKKQMKRKFESDFQMRQQPVDFIESYQRTQT